MTSINYLTHSLNAELNTFRKYVEERGSTDLFVIALKMLEFVETDRAALWANTTKEASTNTEKKVVNLLKQLRRMMLRYDAENEEIELLAVMHSVCTKLLLIFNGDGVDADSETANGLCFVDLPTSRPAQPLTKKFGIDKFWFVRQLHTAGGAGGKPTCTTNDADTDYNKLKPARRGSSTQWTEWETYSLAERMSDVIHEVSKT